VAAGSGKRLAEVSKEKGASAGASFREADESIESLAASGPLGYCALLDKMAVDDDITAAVEKKAIRGQAVATSASDFLVIAFEVFG
jgi:hypothetical protein